jgi:hypothetical protein
MPTLWAMTVSFASVNPGDSLPIVIKWETEEAIRRSNDPSGADAADASVPESPVPEPPDGEQPSLPAGAIRAYAEELLLKAFPPESLADPARRLDLELTGRVTSADTVSLLGKVVSKREQAGRGLVECEIVVEKQLPDLTQQIIGSGTALVPLPL